ncbi:hypothetical protein Tco_0497751 [Tanacetum coccineum]
MLDRIIMISWQQTYTISDTEKERYKADFVQQYPTSRYTKRTSTHSPSTTIMTPRNLGENVWKMIWKVLSLTKDDRESPELYDDLEHSVKTKERNHSRDTMLGLRRLINDMRNIKMTMAQDAA